MSEASEIPAKDEIGDYFLDLWSKSRSLQHNDEEEKEELPMALDTEKASTYAVVSPDKLTMRYSNVRLNVHNVGVVRANHPAPMKRILYYFEVLVRNIGEKGRITVGFATSAFSQPGTDENSCEYSIEVIMDSFFIMDIQLERCDTVGAGIHYGTNNFFFT